MAEEKRDLSAATPAVDIPDLKKKEEEERKGGGVLWRSPKAGGTGLGEAAGGARAAASSAARWAASTSGRGLGALLSGLASTFLGKVFLAAAVSLLLGGAAAVLKKMSAKAGAGGPSLGGVSSGLNVRRGGMDRMLAYGKGLFSGQASSGSRQGQPAGGQNEASSGAAQKAAVPPVADIGAIIAESERSAGQRGGLPHDLSGAKLSSQLGGSSASQSSPSGLSGVLPGDAGALGSGSGGGGKGALSKMPAGGARAVLGSRRSVQGARSKRAIGQLKLAQNLTSGLAGATQEGARTMAADAFDGGKTIGGVLNASPPASVGGTAVGGGGEGASGAGGAGGAAGSNGWDGTVPSDLKGANADDIVAQTGDQPVGKDVTNWAGPVETALDMAQKAFEKNQQGLALLVAGGAAMALGIGLAAGGVSAIAAGGVIAAAVGMLTAGTALRLEAQRMTEDARKLGSQIKEQYGQEYQKKIIDECLNQALEGTKPSECDPATKPNPKSNVAESVQKERDSTYQIQENQNGEPIQ